MMLLKYKFKVHQEIINENDEQLQKADPNETKISISTRSNCWVKEVSNIVFRMILKF